MPVITPSPRPADEVRGTSRSAAGSLWRTYKERSGEGFLKRSLWPWITHYLSLMFTPRRPFPTYVGTTGIFKVPNQCRVGLAGDWGTGTASAYRVAEEMKQQQPHVTIHLGDVYYSGTT